MAWNEFNFTNEFQDMMLACIVLKPTEFWTFNEIIKPEYFNGVDAFETAFALQQYILKYGKYPNFSTLMNTLFVKFERNNPDKASQLVDYVQKLTDLDTSDYEGVRDLMIKFAKERSLFAALKKIHGAQMEGKTNEVDAVSEVEAALSVGEDNRKGGIELKRDYKEVIDRVSKPAYGVKTGFNHFDRVWKSGWAPGWLIVPLAPPKSYKCLGKGTGILMFDGSIKAVENIAVGDLLMGDDSTPRTVITCGKGHGPLYRVEQSSGKDFVCNDAHVLCVKSKTGAIQEISAEEYALKSKWFNREWNGYKATIHFPTQSVPLDPYFTGLWLGDGTTGKAEICVADRDSEISVWLSQYADKLKMAVSYTQGSGCKQFRFVNRQKGQHSTCSKPNCNMPVRAGAYCHKHYCSERYHTDYSVCPEGRANRIQTKLSELGILNCKRIPEVYRINDRLTRLQILAGLIDSDGSYVEKKGLIFTNSSQQLAEDTCWLARSLGFHAKLAQYASSIKSTGYVGTSWRVTLTGKLSDIPTKLKRKQCKNSVKRWGGRYSIEVKPIGEGDYYGFTIDGNQRFVLDDFTVTHNTTFCINLALKMLGPGSEGDIIYYACEISDDLAMMRALHNLSGINTDGLFTGVEKFKRAARDGIRSTLGSGRLFFKSFPSKTASMADIEQHAKYLVNHEKAKPIAIIVDYAETVRPLLTGKNISDWRQQADIYTSARAMGSKLGCCVIMPDRCNKETVGKKVPNMGSFQGSFEKAGVVDIAIGLCFTEAERLMNRVRYFLFLNRHGPQLLHFEGKVDPELMRMTVDDEIQYVPEDEDEPKAKRNSNGRGKMAKQLQEALGNND